jgi:Copper transport outer membrane protein, MctB
MIDFRYHLISLIAVFLALGLGILMGSVVLDEQLVERLEGRVRGFADSNDELRRRVSELDDRVDAFQAFTTEAEGRLLGGALTNQRVVVVEFEGTDGSVTDGLREAVEMAGGRVVTTITLTDRLALNGPAERDQLALILRSSAGTTRGLRIELAEELGVRMAAASLTGAAESSGSVVATRRLEDLLEVLREEDYVAVDNDTGESVPPDSIVAVVAGSSEEAPFSVRDVSLTLSESLADRGLGVTVGEPSTSEWGVVASVRDDAEASNEVSTVDQAETVVGRIAIALALSEANDGITGHYGLSDGADSVIPTTPEPTPAA